MRIDLITSTKTVKNILRSPIGCSLTIMIFDTTRKKGQKKIFSENSFFSQKVVFSTTSLLIQKKFFYLAQNLPYSLVEPNKKFTEVCNSLFYQKNWPGFFFSPGRCTLLWQNVSFDLSCIKRMRSRNLQIICQITF